MLLPSEWEQAVRQGDVDVAIDSDETEECIWRLVVIRAGCRLSVVILVLYTGYAVPGDDSDLTRKIEAHLRTVSPNAAVLVMRNRQTLLARGYGFASYESASPIEPTTQFLIGSITKQFTATAIMMLVENGMLDLHAPVSEYLDDLPAEWQQLTTHQLLTHTSGLMHSWALEGFAATMAEPRDVHETLVRFHQEPLLSAPGTEFNYSGVGYFLLAALIEKLSGETYESYLSSEVFGPLQMSNSGAHSPEQDLDNLAESYMYRDDTRIRSPDIHTPILTGGGNLYSSIEDMAKWCNAMIGSELLTHSSFKRMYSTELNNFGYGWGVHTDDRGITYRAHAGGVVGFNSVIVVAPESELCVVVLSNDFRANAPRIGFELFNLATTPSSDEGVGVD